MSMNKRPPLRRSAPVETENDGVIEGRNAVIEALRPIREEATRILADKAYLEGIYKEGAERASHLAAKTLRKVYKKVGFVAR